MEDIKSSMEDSNSNTYKVFSEIERLLKLRNTQKAFHPDSKQFPLELGSSFFGIKRVSEQEETIYHVSNITAAGADLNTDFLESKDTFVDLISGQKVKNGENIKLSPYQTVWLKQT
jgi:sucrose phosphorylase